MIAKLLQWQNKTIASAALVLGVSAFASRLLGVVRDRLLASRFGAGEELDMYFAAFRIPDFLYALVVLGGLSAVFLPLFSEYMEKNKEEAWRFVNNLLHVYGFALLALAGLLLVFVPFIMELVVPGFSEAQKEGASLLTRLMLLSPFFFALSSVVSGVLHYFQRFAAYALAPVMYNLGIILGIVFFVPFAGIWGVAYGVILGAFLHLVIQLPSLFLVGFSWKAVFEPFDPALRRAFFLALPRTLGGVAYQINLIVVTALASLLSAGSIAVFTFADNLQHFPAGLIGVPLALAAFPMLSRAAAQQDMGQFQTHLLATAKKIVLLVVPLAFVLFLIREPLIRVILQTGAFESQDAALTASVFGVFTLGMVFQALIPLLVRSFFSLQDTRTPTVIGISSVLLNIVLAFSFLELGWGIVALPWALVIAGAFQAVLLSVFLYASLVRLKENP